MASSQSHGSTYCCWIHKILKLLELLGSTRERVAQLGKVGDFNAGDPSSKPADNHCIRRCESKAIHLISIVLGI